MKIFTRAMLLLLFLPTLMCCKEGTGVNQSEKHDPTKPVVISDFMPQEGQIRTKFIIQGDNFGNDKSKVKVFFNKTEALVINVKNNAIYTLVPRQPGDECDISVVVEGQEPIIVPGKKFTYHKVEVVTTIAGKAKEPAGTADGDINEATFNLPRSIGIDKEYNIILYDEGSSRVRLISLQNSKVISITTASLGTTLHPFCISKNQTFYSILDNSKTIYKFDPAKEWKPSVVYKYNTSTYQHSLSFGPESDNERYVYSRQNLGVLLRWDITTGENPTVFAGKANDLGVTGQGAVIYCHVAKCFYVSSVNSCAIYKVSDDGKTIELFAGGNGKGYSDGPRLQAAFNGPQYMCVNSRGDLFIAETTGHRIRKIDYETGLVSTAAGTGVAGYTDGLPDVAQFNNPMGICCDKDDNLYVADKNNRCIRKFSIE